jgi:hypothetical protein
MAGRTHARTIGKRDGAISGRGTYELTEDGGTVTFLMGQAISGSCCSAPLALDWKSVGGRPRKSPRRDLRRDHLLSAATCHRFVSIPLQTNPTRILLRHLTG